MRCPVFTISGVWHIDTWFADSPFGVHVLLKSIDKLCDRAGFKGHYTNHSLRATAATRLYEAGIAEQINEKSSPQFDRTNAQTMNNIEWVKYFIQMMERGKFKRWKRVKFKWWPVRKKDEKCDPGDSNRSVPCEFNITSGKMSFFFKVWYVSRVTFTESFTEMVSIFVCMYVFPRRW